VVDSEMALTFSVRNNPGVYALLLGSGVSTEAGVPTGWGVVKDLIRKLAEIEDEEIETDPEEWYEDTYDQEPKYDDLIKQIAPSKPDRQSLLEKYFEPTSEEREQGIKTPSEAHKSIAWLIDEGYINIVVTTNFDQLLEQALSERGITPVVISSASDAKGAAPLSHQEAVIMKVNGDYKETNIKNITEELENYSAPIKKLGKIFDEYELIVCGWSGDWDIALREAMLRCERRRYATYWAYHGSLEDSADELMAHRDGTPIQITGAGDFFSDLKENVEALEGSESGAPLTREVARERVKRYMTREEQKLIWRICFETKLKKFEVDFLMRITSLLTLIPTMRTMTRDYPCMKAVLKH
jgi:phosphoserine phosphatase